MRFCMHAPSVGPIASLCMLLCLCVRDGQVLFMAMHMNTNTTPLGEAGDIATMMHACMVVDESCLGGDGTHGTHASVVQKMRRRAPSHNRAMCFFLLCLLITSEVTTSRVWHARGAHAVGYFLKQSDEDRDSCGGCGC
jgi:hypothetical protein